MTDTYLDIAGLPLRLLAPGDIPLPRAYSPFITDAATARTPIATLTVTYGRVPQADGLTPLGHGVNDLGATTLYHPSPGTWAIGLRLPADGLLRMLTADGTFTRARLTLPPSDPRDTYAIDSMMRILTAQAIVSHRAFMLHASCIRAHDGRAYLFMGPSGTGKSTHSRMWGEAFGPAVELVNDDNPIVRIHPDGTVRAHGTPWSGKTPCYRRVSAPVAALVRLNQAPHDRYTPLADADAFMAILPGVSVITRHPALYDAACTTVAAATGSVAVGTLDCLPHPQAARVCLQGIGPGAASASPQC